MHSPSARSKCADMSDPGVEPVQPFLLVAISRASSRLKHSTLEHKCSQRQFWVPLIPKGHVQLPIKGTEEGMFNSTYPHLFVTHSALLASFRTNTRSQNKNVLSLMPLTSSMLMKAGCISMFGTLELSTLLMIRLVSNRGRATIEVASDYAFL